MNKFEESIKQFQRSIARVRDYAADEDDPDMKKMYSGDARDLGKVLTRYKNRKFEEAMRMASGLDTACRDHIPDSAWYLMKEFD